MRLGTQRRYALRRLLKQRGHDVSELRRAHDLCHVARVLREQIALAARHRCGYCLMSSSITGTPMEIDHIIPVLLGGSTIEENLWLACSMCNDHQGIGSPPRTWLRRRRGRVCPDLGRLARPRSGHGRLGREADVLEDLTRGRPVCDRGEQAKPAATVRAAKEADRKRAPHELCPVDERRRCEK